MSIKTVLLIIGWHGLLALGGSAMGWECTAMMVFASVVAVLVANAAAMDDEEEKDGGD